MLYYDTEAKRLEALEAGTEKMAGIDKNDIIEHKAGDGEKCM